MNDACALCCFVAVAEKKELKSRNIQEQGVKLKN